MVKKSFFLFFLILFQLHAERGIVIACSDRYMSYAFPFVAHLKLTLDSPLPVEIWHVGDELSPRHIEKLAAIPGVTIHNLVDTLGDFAYKCKGWQIKPEIINATNFTDVMLVDADAYFVRDPSFLFDHPEYLDKGAILFQDLNYHTYPFAIDLNNPNYAMSKHFKQKEFVLAHIPQPSSYVLKEWRHYWKKELPTIENPVLGGEIESGCVVFNKEKHVNGLQKILELNRDYHNTYQYLHGDKDTFWIGFEMAHEPYYVEPAPAFHLRPRGISQPECIHISHLFDGLLLWCQKDIYPPNNPIFVTDWAWGEKHIPLSKQEVELLFIAYKSISRMRMLLTE